MLRLLIGTGLLLMVVGFGAAGWQYWQNAPSSLDPLNPVPEDSAATAGPGTSQGWLISATGGLVPRDMANAYLTQDRFVPGRMATIVQTAPLTALLAEGEMLPEQPYLEVFADIRAPRLADGLCPVMLALVAEDCAVHSARVIEGSVDPIRGTARFRFELAYRLQPDAGELPDASEPDLSENVFVARSVTWEGEAGSPDLVTVETTLGAVIETGRAACAAEDAGQACRITGLALDWAPGTAASGLASIGWLSSLPDGMFVAPSLDPAPEG